MFVLCVVGSVAVLSGLAAVVDHFAKEDDESSVAFWKDQVDKVFVFTLGQDKVVAARIQRVCDDGVLMIVDGAGVRAGLDTKGLQWTEGRVKDLSDPMLQLHKPVSAEEEEEFVEPD